MPGHLTPAAVRAQIAAPARSARLYLVTGDDEAEMSAIGTALAESVDEDFRAFNVQRFYGSDAGSTVAAVLDAASTYPLLAPRRVVLLLQAEKALVARKARKRGPRRDRAGRRCRGRRRRSDRPAGSSQGVRCAAARARGGGAPGRGAAAHVRRPGEAGGRRRVRGVCRRDPGRSKSSTACVSTATRPNYSARWRGPTWPGFAPTSSASCCMRRVGRR